jgi:hypothetical protein
MKKIGTNIRKYLQSVRTPEFVAGAAIPILLAILSKVFSGLFQNTLNHPIFGYYLMAAVALICLILVAYFLMQIEKLVRKSNKAQFITSKLGRLNKMIECIKEAERSIYILSDLSGTEETQLQEHEKYLDALNQVLDNKKVEVKRIVVPNSAGGRDAEADPNWIYTAPITKAYQKHFRRLQECDDSWLKHTTVSRNVSMMIIDNKYLFWKPELTYGDKDLDKLMDGGLYLEDFTQEVTADFAEAFLKMHTKATWTIPEKAQWNKPDKLGSKKNYENEQIKEMKDHE